MTMVRHVLLAVLLTAAGAFAAPERGARIDSLAYRIRVDGNRALVTFFKRTTVLDATGVQHVSAVLGESRFVHIKSFTVTQFDTAGKVLLKKNKSDMIKDCGFGQSFELYNDHCFYSLDLPARAYPYVVQNEYQLELQSLFFLHEYGLQKRVPIIHASVELDYPDGSPVAWKLYHHAAEPRVELLGGRHLVRWILDSIPALPELRYASAKDAEGIHLDLSAERFELEGYRFDGRTWKNVGLWQRQLSLGRHGADSLSAIPAPGLSVDSAAAAIYRQITAAVRYVAVSIGLSGWQPHPPNQVAAKGYGDCKDMSGLLSSRLRALGIEAYPCLVLTSSEGWIDTSFVSFKFNHVITMVPIGADTLWFDPTCSNCPPGDLPSVDEGIPVLAITDTGGVIVRTPPSTADQNRVCRFAIVTADSSGTLSVRARAVASGNQGRSIRASLRGATREETSRFIKEWFLTDERKFKLVDCHVANLDSLHQDVELTALFRGVKPIDQVGGTGYLLPFLFSSRDIFGSADLANRKVPIDLRYPYTFVDSITATGPLVRRADSLRLPKSDTARFDGGYAATHFELTSDTVFAILTSSYMNPVIDTSQFPGFIAFLSARRQLLDAPVRIYLKP